jgi:hypothetical protein
MVCFLVKEPVDLGVNCGVGGSLMEKQTIDEHG